MKMNAAGLLITAGALAAGSLLGCASKSDPGPRLQVSGTVDPQTRNLGSARAVAIAGDGRSYSSPLTNGHFTLDLPLGTYRLVIGNQTRTGQLRVVGHLTNTTANGKIAVIGVKDAGTLNLGMLRPTGTTVGTTTTGAPTTAGATTTTGGTRTLSAETEKRGESEHDHDDAEDDDDDDHSDDEAKLCEDGDDVELEAEHAPGAAHEAKESEGPKKQSASCDVHDKDHDGDDD